MTTLSLDWWMHQIYRQTKEFITRPSKETETRLTSLLAEFRAHHELQGGIPPKSDEHENLMDFQ